MSNIIKTAEEIKDKIYEFANIQMYYAWKQAANAYRLYPENKHTYAAAEEYLDSKMKSDLDKLIAELYDISPQPQQKEQFNREEVLHLMRTSIIEYLNNPCKTTDQLLAEYLNSKPL